MAASTMRTTSIPGRYSVYVDGVRAGWVSRIGRKWHAMVVADLSPHGTPRGRGYCIEDSARTRNEAVTEIEIFYAAHSWRLAVP